MVRLLQSILAVALFASQVWAEKPAAADDAGRAWVGKHRDEVVAKWGEPTKTKKRRKGGETLVYELPVYLGDYLPADTDPASVDLSISREDEGDGRLKVEEKGAAREAAYKTVRFRFHLDATGRVAKVEFPKGVDARLP